MATRSALLVLATAIALALSLVMVAPPAQAASSRPTWTVGDYWVYNVTGEGGGMIPAFGSGTSTLRYDVVGMDSIQVGGSAVSVYTTKVNFTFKESFSSMTVTVYVTGNIWFRTSDLAPAKLVLGASLMGSAISFTGIFSPPPDIHWPLTAGDSWTVTTTVSFTAVFGGRSNTNSSTQSITQTAQADQSLSVKAGTFTVTPVKETIGGESSYAVSYWSSSAGNSASQRSYDKNGTEVGKMDLQSYNYQGGSFLTAVFLGLPGLVWIILVVVVVIGVAAVLLLRRRRPPTPMGYPPMQPAPGQPPYQPPSGGMPPSPPSQP